MLKTRNDLIKPQNEMTKKQNRNLDVEFDLAKLKKLHLTLKVQSEFGVVDFE